MLISVLVLTLAACGAVAPAAARPDASTAADQAATEANKALVRRFFTEAWSTGDVSRRDAFLAPGYRGHIAGAAEPIDADGWTAFLTAFRRAFPDATFTVQDMVAEGDRVAVRLTMRGTHLGEMNGLPPTGRRVTVTGISIERVADGRIVEGWNQNDALGLLQQLGALPQP
jgi:steroid delta-isomerase-like uncharacterized protein